MKESADKDFIERMAEIRAEHYRGGYVHRQGCRPCWLINTLEKADADRKRLRGCLERIIWEYERSSDSQSVGAVMAWFLRIARAVLEETK